MKVDVIGGSLICNDLVVCINMVRVWIWKRLVMPCGWVCITMVVLDVRMRLDRLSGWVLLVKWWMEHGRFGFRCCE